MELWNRTIHRGYGVRASRSSVRARRSLNKVTVLLARSNAYFDRPSIRIDLETTWGHGSNVFRRMISIS
jgi:hypothetical protein